MQVPCLWSSKTNRAQLQHSSQHRVPTQCWHSGTETVHCQSCSNASAKQCQCNVTTDSRPFQSCQCGVNTTSLQVQYNANLMTAPIPVSSQHNPIQSKCTSSATQASAPWLLAPRHRLTTQLRLVQHNAQRTSDRLGRSRATPITGILQDSP